MAPNAELPGRISSGSRSVTEEITSFGKRSYKLGTRTSPLALRQVEEILTAVRKFYPFINIQIVGIDTYGDKDKETAISQVEGTDFFTKEIDEALLNGKIDFALHSAKDLPDKLREGLVAAAITKSIDPYDALVSKSDLPLQELPFGAKIGTSSQRRRDQLKRYRDDFNIVDLRGNIEKRLEELETSDLDAIVIAAAGLVRLGLVPSLKRYRKDYPLGLVPSLKRYRKDYPLGLEHRIAQRIPFEILRPHPLQGSLAIVTGVNDLQLINLLSKIDSRETILV